MTFEQLYSSSSGNLYVVTAASGKRLLIECGVTWPKLQKALGYDLSGFVGCLLSHEHKDHSKAVKDVIKAGIDVFASTGTLDALGLLHGHRAIHMADRTPMQIFGGFSVLPFRINHDAVEPIGFIVHEIDTKENLLFVTDTSHITPRFKIPFNIIAIECSYDKNILQYRVDRGSIHEEVAKRLLTSHMERKVTMRYLTEYCNLSKCREIHLLHMSGDNIIREKTCKEFEGKFFIKTVAVGDQK